MPINLLSPLKSDPLRSLSIGYLALPGLIFIIGWLWWPYSLGLGTLLCTGIFWATRGENNGCPLAQKQDWRFYSITAVLLLGWLSLSGIGGFGHQNQDWLYRNAVLQVLIEKPWPTIVSVHDEQRLLVSYIAFYLPAAVAGKIGQVVWGNGWWVANMVLWLWSVTGVFLSMGWLMRHSLNYSLIAVLLLIAFSGVDIVGWVLTFGDLPEATVPIGFWAQMLVRLHFSSMTGQLYWVPHQALAAWIAVCLIIHEGLISRSSRNLVFIGGITLLWSPFVTMGLIPYAILVCIRSRFTELFSGQNLIGLMVAGVSALYLTSIQAGKLPHGFHWTLQSVSVVYYLWIVSLFLLTKFGAYSVFIRQTLKDQPLWQSQFASLFWTTIVSLTLIPMYHLGIANDFCMRVSLPAYFVLLILITHTLKIDHFKQAAKRWPVIALALLLIIGAWGPRAEWLRSFAAIKSDPAIWSIGVPIENVTTFEASANKLRSFTDQYSVPIDNPFTKFAAPPLIDGGR